MKRFCITFMLILLMSAPAHAQDFKTDQEFNVWLSTYYQHPEPGRTASALKYFSTASFYNANAAMPVVAFFSALFGQNDALLQKIFTEIDKSGSEQEKIILINALSLTHTKKSRELMNTANAKWTTEPLHGTIQGQLTKPFPDLKSITVQTPTELDMLWATFFATGAEWPIEKMIAVLSLAEEGHGDDLLVGGAAAWSLSSNVQQHPRVLEICRKQLTKADGTTKTLLEKIIKGAKKR